MAVGSSRRRPTCSPAIWRWFSANAPMPAATGASLNTPGSLPSAVPTADSATGSAIDAAPCPICVPAQLRASPTPLMSSTFATSGAYSAWRCSRCSRCWPSRAAFWASPAASAAASSMRAAFMSPPTRPAFQLRRRAPMPWASACSWRKFACSWSTMFWSKLLRRMDIESSWGYLFLGRKEPVCVAFWSISSCRESRPPPMLMVWPDFGSLM